MKKNWRNYLYIFTITFFVLGFFNIIFGWLGLVCLIVPFIFLAKDKRKTWCQNYCPRANFFSTLFRNKSLTDKCGPDWLIKGKVKWIILVYFLFNFFVLTMSTIMVFKGRIEPMEKIRFMMAFKIPWDIPQLLNITSFPDWVIHLSFRAYSMMFTTTVLGLLLAWIFKPRTWCTICPINTISDITLKRTRKNTIFYYLHLI